MPVLSKQALTAKLRPLVVPHKSVQEPPRDGPKRTAVFAVHGVSPIQRYAFQDQVATAFQAYLNAHETPESGIVWDAVVHWPRVAKRGADGLQTVRPSALRLYRKGDDPDNPTGRIYDVYEGYWSPLSKGKTNIVSAVRWLLNATFLGTSSTASIPCTPEKLQSDLFYVAALLGLAVAACAMALASGLAAWALLFALLPNANHVLYSDFIQNPFGSALKLPIIFYAEFLVDIVIAYVLAQIVVVYRVGRLRDTRTATLRADATDKGTFHAKTIGARTFHRAIIWVLWIVLAALLASAIAMAFLFAKPQLGSPLLVVIYTVAVVLAVGFLQIARWAADFAVENVLGDVQIYTTHDNNSAFYAVRQQIIAAVATALNGILSAVDDPTLTEPEPYYDAIHIFGHSLGSTISMDVLIYLRQMTQEGTVAKQQWNNIRSLTTFGTALEKTRFFFDVRQPSLNAAQDQWANDVYGKYFIGASSALRQPASSTGIFWSNYWYFRDIVANAIVSYTSDVAIGSNFRWSSDTHRICRDVELPHDKPRFAWVHSDYLADPLFWVEVGPILTGRAGVA